jgi:RimJ/RimL family protein N-acetyltransferase
MMLDRAAGRIVGSIGLFQADWEVRSAEIGYGVLSDERGKGYASEALGAVARWALTEGGIQRAWLTANTDNVASVRVAERAGFRREGTLRRAALEDDGLHDLAVFPARRRTVTWAPWPQRESRPRTAGQMPVPSTPQEARRSDPIWATRPARAARYSACCG